MENQIVKINASEYGLEESKAKEIEKYNDQLVSDGIKSKPFQLDKMLWIPHHFSPCNLPVTSTEKGFPIFGKYESTPILSDVLKGKIFYIISIHFMLYLIRLLTFFFSLTCVFICRTLKRNYEKKTQNT